MQSSALGDIGATNARFALAVGGRLGPIKWIEVARYPSVTDAIEFFLQGQFRVKVAKARLAVAGPVSNERCTFTNCAWTVDGSQVRNRFEFNNVQIINDFEATALSLPYLKEQDLHAVGGGRAVSGAPMVVLGPGSGLGVAGLVGDDIRRIVVASEGGHATLPAASVREDAVLEHLRKRYGHVSAERVPSGAGLENLYHAIGVLDGIEVPPRNAAQITNAALQETCPTSRATLEGGVYIAGGIAPRSWRKTTDPRKAAA